MVAAHEQPRARGGRGVATALGEHARAARVKVIATTKPSPPPPTAAVTDDAAVRPSPTARHSSICVVSEPGDAHTSRHAWPNATRSITTGTMETASCRTSAPRIALGVVARRRARVVAAAARVRTRRRAGGERRVAQGELAAAKLERAGKL
jgi:hypothetical protein